MEKLTINGVEYVPAGSVPAESMAGTMSELKIKSISYKNSDGFEWSKEYDSNGNETHHKNSSGFEYWKEYDSNGNETHYKDSDGEEWSKEYTYY